MKLTAIYIALLIIIVAPEIDNKPGTVPKIKRSRTVANRSFLKFVVLFFCPSIHEVYEPECTAPAFHAKLSLFVIQEPIEPVKCYKSHN